MNLSSFWEFRDKMWKHWPAIAAIIDVAGTIFLCLLVAPWILHFIGWYFDLVDGVFK